MYVHAIIFTFQPVRRVMSYFNQSYSIISYGTDTVNKNIKGMQLLIRFNISILLSIITIDHATGNNNKNVHSSIFIDVLYIYVCMYHGL